MEQLLALPKETLVDIIKDLYVDADKTQADQYIPAGYNVDSSGFKGHLYTGTVDKDMEMDAITPGISDIKIKDKEIYLNGDLVEIFENYKALELKCKGYRVTGLIKAEILARMVVDMYSIKVGEFGGWSKYLIQYKSHTLVVNTKGSMAGFRLLKNDAVARKMYAKTYPRRPIQYWMDMDEDEKIYGSKDISLPNAIDTIMEEAVEAMGQLDRGLKYQEVASLIEEYGWSREPDGEVERLTMEVDDLRQELELVS